jgi:D-alanyl-D-alanine carboxypeptidase/D-alanyl-D-alanine-endopeptidase (penicillin-binding protein 4)
MFARLARAVLVLAAVPLAAGVPTASSSAGARSGTLPLGAALGRALVSKNVDPARTAAIAVDLQTGHVIFRRNAQLALAPASTEKLSVALAALRLLGPGYRFRTQVEGAGELVRHEWRGDLVLVGYGDPTLDREDLEKLARDVASFGIRHVTGRVLGDESFYDTRRGAPGWKRSFVGIESPPLSALSVVGTGTRGGRSPAAAAAAAFEAALSRRHVRVSLPPQVGRAPADAFPLAIDLSEPLAEIVREMDRQSDNFVAEMIVKQLGAVLSGHGSTAAGVRVVRAALADAGAPLIGVRLADGSGLSLLDRTTVLTLVSVLRAGAADPGIRDAFLTSLAVAGVDGTLRDRLVRRATHGHVIGKTGTTDEASALAGFVRRRYVFAVVQNGSPVAWWSARRAQDRFVTVLARSG